jgi:hypothetical protein
MFRLLEDLSHLHLKSVSARGSGINEMVRRRVDYNSAVHIKEDHRHAHRIDRYRCEYQQIIAICTLLGGKAEEL